LENHLELKWVIAYLGLGANLGDRASSISAALAGLDQQSDIEVLRRSSLYETAPIGMTDQPEFLNTVVEIRTTLSPLALLAQILALEHELGRVRTIRWGPRVIDIDILLYGEETYMGPELTIPHPRLTERAFALAPLAELAPDACFPDGETSQKKWKQFQELRNNNGIKIVA
jgi:2-amino-4-hydroxy-6-hydroxymethyldihydropteridine diphosphokinase